MVETRRFPLLAPETRGRTAPRSIPWSVAERAYEKYSARYGRAQSLERLAERGGFGPGEMDDLYPEWERATLGGLDVEEHERVIAAYRKAAKVFSDANCLFHAVSLEATANDTQRLLNAALGRELDYGCRDTLGDALPRKSKGVTP